MSLLVRFAKVASSSISIIFLVVLALSWSAVGAADALAARAAPEQVAEAQTPPAEKPPQNEIITGRTIFFGCMVGATVGVVLPALPPIAGWAMMAGALPGFVAVLVSSGIGCSIGLFSGVIVSTIGWVFDKIGQAFSAIF